MNSPLDLPPEPDIVVPLLTEELEVGVRSVVTGHVRVKIQTSTQEQVVDEQLESTDIEISRVTVGRVVESHPPVREDGDTTIISVVEEVLVVERRLVLKEEIHVRRVRTQDRLTEKVVLRSQHVTVERSGA